MRGSLAIFPIFRISVDLAGRYATESVSPRRMRLRHVTFVIDLS